MGAYCVLYFLRNVGKNGAPKVKEILGQAGQFPALRPECPTVGQTQSRVLSLSGPGTVTVVGRR